MGKRTFQEVRKTILEVLSDGKSHSYGELERKVDTNWKTIRNHCQDLELFDFIKISNTGVTITKKGLDFLKKI